MSSETSDEAPGWDAIDAALLPIYGKTAPQHYAAALPAFLSGNDPLQGISAYRSEYGGRPHWHFVTYGYSELYDKESDDPDQSGFGFEMTVRVIDPEATAEPPPWVLSMLQNIARYVFQSGNAFAVGHHMTANGPIALGRQTLLEACAFVADPQLPAITTPNGRVEFLQLVGLTLEEYEASKRWDTVKLLSVVPACAPALVTDLSRPSWLEDPELRRRVEAGTARDGSSMGGTFSSRGSFEREGDRAILGVAANALDNLKLLVRGRLGFGKEAFLNWPDGLLEVKRAEVTRALTRESGTVTLELGPEDCAAILDLPIQRGDYPLPSGSLTIRVLPVDIYDGERKRVVKVIG
jgi:suppressor of fused